jgi:hypothetical protein
VAVFGDASGGLGLGDLVSQRLVPFFAGKYRPLHKGSVFRVDPPPLPQPSAGKGKGKGKGKGDGDDAVAPLKQGSSSACEFKVGR